MTMKPYNHVLTLLALAGLSSCSIARPAWTRHGVVSVPETRISRVHPQPASRQNPGHPTRFRTDHTYSTHNYKHPNKAAYAHRVSGHNGVQVNAPQPGVASLANYKTPVPGWLPVGGVVVEHRLSTDLAGSNYKMPRPLRLPPTVQLNQFSYRLSYPSRDQRIGTQPLRGIYSDSLNQLPPVVNLTTNSLTIKKISKMKTNDSVAAFDGLNAEPADLYMGLGSLAYALAKIDGQIQLIEMQTVKALLVGVPHGDLALHAFFLRENFSEKVEEAYCFGMRRFASNRKILTPVIKREFVRIILQVAQTHDDISRKDKEQEFIKRFRRDLRRL